MFTGKKQSGVSDSELLARYKSAGDLTVLADLFGRYTALVYGVCVKYLKDRDESKDAVMQIFEKLVPALREHNVENFKSWLYATTRNHCLMQIRSRKGKFTEEIPPYLMETAFAVHLEEEPAIEENLGKLSQCIEKLADEQRECVQLFYLEQLCYKDITVRTGFELNKVKSYIQNGKRNLKICMEGNG